MECCPARPPSSAWRRLPGGTRRLSIWSAASSAEIPKCPAFDFRWQPFRAAGDPKPFCVPVRERSDHSPVCNASRDTCQGGSEYASSGHLDSRAAVRASDLECVDDRPIRRRNALDRRRAGAGPGRLWQLGLGGSACRLSRNRLPTRSPGRGEHTKERSSPGSA